jgi:hypothetical protein
VGDNEGGEVGMVVGERVVNEVDKLDVSTIAPVLVDTSELKLEEDK